MKADPGPHRPDWVGSTVGIIVFLVGIGLLILAFKFAFDLFAVPPREALGVSKTRPVELNQTAQSFMAVLSNILYLLVMVVVSSIIANRGIKMYTESRHHRPRPAPKE